VCPENRRSRRATQEFRPLIQQEPVATAARSAVLQDEVARDLWAREESGEETRARASAVVRRPMALSGRKSQGHGLAPGQCQMRWLTTRECFSKTRWPATSGRGKEACVRAIAVVRRPTATSEEGRTPERGAHLCMWLFSTECAAIRLQKTCMFPKSLYAPARQWVRLGLIRVLCRWRAALASAQRSGPIKPNQAKSNHLLGLCP